MKKLTAKGILSKILCISIIAVFFVLATGSGAVEDFKEGFEEGYEMGSEMMDDYLDGGFEDEDAYADDYVYEGNDYDYEDSYDYGDTGSECIECGISIPSNRSYCDNCLYGTCITCGKKLNPADQKIYCDSCSSYRSGSCYVCGDSNANNSLEADGETYNLCDDCYIELMSSY